MARPRAGRWGPAVRVGAADGERVELAVGEGPPQEEREAWTETQDNLVLFPRQTQELRLTLRSRSHEGGG